MRPELVAFEIRCVDLRQVAEADHFGALAGTSDDGLDLMRGDKAFSCGSFTGSMLWFVSCANIRAVKFSPNPVGVLNLTSTYELT